MSAQRSRSRRLAMQALYQWQMTGQNVADIEAQFLAEQDMSGAEIPYFQELLHEVPARLNDLDEALAPLLSRDLRQVDPVERAVLRIAAYELSMRSDIPYRVVINEAVNLTKRFGAEQGDRFVNGVLDKLARRLRQAEMKA